LAELKAIGKETEYYNNNLFNSIYLRAIYNTIIYHKGVCFNFSYAYPFLLEGSGISTYGVEIFREDGTGGHAFNIIEVMKNENTPKYYIADLTYGNGKKDGSVVEIIESFAINKDKYLNFIKDKKIDKIKILDLKCPHSEIMFKDLSPEPLFSAMCTKMEDITSLTKAKQQTIKHILERDIVKPIENGLER